LGDDDPPNRKKLIESGLNPITFQGVDARKDEHHHVEKVHELCQYTCPKSTIGCGLSHILLANKLYSDKIPLALVLEDDAYPKFFKIDFDEIMNSVPDDWEIIKLHSGGYCDNSFHRGMSGSTAAYLINRKGMYKVQNLKLYYHIDLQMNLSDIKMYKVNNIFWTDESSSHIREKTSDKHWLSYFLPKYTCGEQTPVHFFKYKIFRVPGTNIEITNGVFINFILVLVIIFVVYNATSRS
jgi:GR25 family glycosyltransferase involved in LPS biosynthesis